MRPLSTGGAGRVANYQWAKRYRVRTTAMQIWRRYLKRAAHRADRQAARLELLDYDDERYDDPGGDDADDLA